MGTSTLLVMASTCARTNQGDGMKNIIGRNRMRALLLAGVCAMAVMAVGASSASAQYYCWGTFSAGSGCLGPRHTLIANYVADPAGGASPRVCAGQHNSSGNWTGSYACGYGGAIKNYCQCNLYYPKAHNGDSYSFYMGGDSAW